MTGFQSFVRNRMAAYGAAGLILFSGLGMSPIAHADDKTKTAPAAANAAANPLDTLDNRQAAADLCTTFFISLTKVYTPKGVDPAYEKAKEPWNDPDIKQKLASIPDAQLPAAVTAMTHFPDLGRSQIESLDHANKNGVDWGAGYGAADPVQAARIEGAASDLQDSQINGRRVLFLGLIIKSANVQKPSPDSIWVKDVVPEMRYFYDLKKPGETNYQTFVRLKPYGEKYFGPKTLKIISTLVAIRDNAPQQNTRVASNMQPNPMGQ